MNISLTPEHKDFIESKVRSGAYSSAIEVVQHALRLLEERDERREAKLAALRADIQKGIDDLEAGRFTDGPTAMREIREKLLAMKRGKA